MLPSKRKMKKSQKEDVYCHFPSEYLRVRYYLGLFHEMNRFIWGKKTYQRCKRVPLDSDSITHPLYPSFSVLPLAWRNENVYDLLAPLSVRHFLFVVLICHF